MASEKSLANLEHGKATRFKKGDERTSALAYQGGKARGRKYKVGDIVTSILNSSPEIDEKLEESIKKMGIDTDDPSQLTLMALMSIKVIQKALNKGDLDAYKTALEAAGQVVEMKDKIQLERIKLEREKMKFAREMAAMRSAGQNGDNANGIIEDIVRAVGNVE